MHLEYPMWDPKDSDNVTPEEWLVFVEILVEALNAVSKRRQQACLEGRSRQNAGACPVVCPWIAQSCSSMAAISTWVKGEG